MIGSWSCLFLLWLVGIIALVLVFRQSFENRSIMVFMITFDQEKITIQDYQNCWPSCYKYYQLSSVLVRPYLWRLFQNYWNDRFSCFLIMMTFSFLMLHFLSWCCIFYRDDICNTLALHFLPGWSFWHFLLCYSIFYYDDIF